MLFNSFSFLLFLTFTFVIYWLLGKSNRHAQNLLLWIASYVFYGWWDWRFLILIALSCSVDYSAGCILDRSTNKTIRRVCLAASLIIQLGILGYFKYFNFFIDSFAHLVTMLGFQADVGTFSIILPAGISFYTFQTMSYTIDVFRGTCRRTRDVVAYFAYVSFFPQLMAGPIERAASLLPQFQSPRSFSMAAASDGARLMLWGLFKKMVIADTAAPYVEAAFSNAESLHGWPLLWGLFFFAIQIYCDFSGYSDMAIGMARFFGFTLNRNFCYPYFSRSPAEFWRRWHITLSTWFRDYVYIPLGGNRGSRSRCAGNMFVTFLVSGLWHGANWNFVFWGALHGLFMLPGFIRRRKSGVAEIAVPPRMNDLPAIAGTFILVMIAWIPFRAASLLDAWMFMRNLIVFETFIPTLPPLSLLGWIAILLSVEWLQKDRAHALSIEHLPRMVRWLLYYLLIAAILFFGNLGSAPFIYFQF